MENQNGDPICIYFRLDTGMEFSIGGGGRPPGPRPCKTERSGHLRRKQPDGSTVRRD